MFPSRFHLPAPLGSTVITRFIATTRTLTPAPLLPAPGQVSLIHDHALPVIPSPTTPCAPVFRQCFLLRAGLATDSLCVAIGGSSDFALLRQSHQSHQAVSSLCRNPWLGCSSTDYPFTSSCSPPRVATTQLLSVSGGKLRQRGTLTLLCTLTLKRTGGCRAATTWTRCVVRYRDRPACWVVWDERLRRWTRRWPVAARQAAPCDETGSSAQRVCLIK